MTGLDELRSPLSFLESGLQDIPHHDMLDTEEVWWKSEGVAISYAIDRAGTPWLRCSIVSENASMKFSILANIKRF